MDIFSIEKNLPSAKPKSNPLEQGKQVEQKDKDGIIHHAGPRGHLSPSQIRQKLQEKKETDAKEHAESLEISRQAKLKAAAKKKQKATEAEVASPEGDKKKADIVLENDPSDPQMKEKLKAALTSGVVNFSGKEQQVLSKILNKK